MPDRDRLLADEAAGAAAFDAVVARIPDDRWSDPTVTPDGWTPVVLAAHVAGWLDECSDVLEAMREDAGVDFSILKVDGGMTAI